MPSTTRTKDTAWKTSYEVFRRSEHVATCEKEIYARLIACAPDLLAACKALLQMNETSKPRKLDEALTWRHNDELATNMAKEAIAKAEEPNDKT